MTNMVPVVIEDLILRPIPLPSLKKSFPCLEASSPKVWELELLGQDVL